MLPPPKKGEKRGQRRPRLRLKKNRRRQEEEVHKEKEGDCGEVLGQFSA